MPRAAAAALRLSIAPIALINRSPFARPARIYARRIAPAGALQLVLLRAGARSASGMAQDGRPGVEKGPGAGAVGGAVGGVDLETGLPASIRFFDVCSTPATLTQIGINLTDDTYAGSYYGRQHHEPDVAHVVARAKRYGVERFLVTGSDVEESRRAIDISRRFRGCRATAGIHPCQAKKFTGDASLAELATLLADPLVAAAGELGLDYDRLHFADAETQKRCFEAQLDLVAGLPDPKPLFLHSRAAHADFVAILKPRLGRLRGVVHSFTGTPDELAELLALGLDVGVNGCSLKTAENLEVVRALPLDRLHLETDGPWCEVKGTSAGRQLVDGGGIAVRLPPAVKREKWRADALVKGRNEPCSIGVVAAVVAAVHGTSIEAVAAAAWANGARVFGDDAAWA